MHFKIVSRVDVSPFMHETGSPFDLAHCKIRRKKIEKAKREGSGPEWFY